jgi:hypothetical protein
MARRNTSWRSRGGKADAQPPQCSQITGCPADSPLCDCLPRQTARRVSGRVDCRRPGERRSTRSRASRLASGPQPKRGEDGYRPGAHHDGVDGSGHAGSASNGDIPGDWSAAAGAGVSRAGELPNPSGASAGRALPRPQDLPLNNLKPARSRHVRRRTGTGPQGSCQEARHEREHHEAASEDMAPPGRARAGRKDPPILPREPIGG